MAWETIEVPRGAYIGWGTRSGQHVTGEVLDYDPTGGTDYNDDPCPQLEIELTERAASYNKAGDRTNYEPGELVVLTCGQVSLKRAVKKADLKAGDLVKITLENLVRVANGEVKEFGIQVDRSGGGSSKVKSGKAADDGGSAADDDEPPF